MKMEFVFDKKKMEKFGYKEEECFNAIRKHFNKYRSSTIKEIESGVFVGTEEDRNAFGATAIFPYTKWFLNVIKEWYWYVDEGDGQGEQRENCLEAYYQVKAVNN